MLKAANMLNKCPSLPLLESCHCSGVPTLSESYIGSGGTILSVMECNSSMHCGLTKSDNGMCSRTTCNQVHQGTQKVKLNKPVFMVKQLRDSVHPDLLLPFRKLDYSAIIFLKQSVFSIDDWTWGCSSLITPPSDYPTYPVN